MKTTYKACLPVILLLIFIMSHVVSGLYAQTLMTCLLEGDLNTAKDRIQNYGSGRLNFKYPGHSGWTALMIASEMGYTDIVKMLVDKKAKINITAIGDLDALMVACVNNEYDIAEYLLKNGADTDNAIKFKRNRDFMEDIIYLPPKYFGYSSTGWNAMFYACIGGDTLLMELLHKHGASYGQINQSGENLLFAAACSDDPGNALKLLSEGVNVNQISNEGFTPFMNACLHGNLEIIKLLTEHGADVEAVNKERKSALYYAALRKKKENLQYLFELGIEPKIFRPKIEDYLATATLYETYADIHSTTPGDSTLCKDSYMIAAQCYHEVGQFYRKINEGVRFNGSYIAPFYIISFYLPNDEEAAMSERVYFKKAYDLEALALEYGK